MIVEEIIFHYIWIVNLENLCWKEEREREKMWKCEKEWKNNKKCFLETSVVFKCFFFQILHFVLLKSLSQEVLLKRNGKRVKGTILGVYSDGS